MDVSLLCLLSDFSFSLASCLIPCLNNLRPSTHTRPFSIPSSAFAPSRMICSVFPSNSLSSRGSFSVFLPEFLLQRRDASMRRKLSGCRSHTNARLDSHQRTGGLINATSRVYSFHSQFVMSLTSQTGRKTINDVEELSTPGQQSSGLQLGASTVEQKAKTKAKACR